MTTQTPARAIVGRVAARHATIAAPHHLAGNCADCLTERAPCDARVTAAIAEAGLALRDAVVMPRNSLEVPGLAVAAVAEFDAAVRAACGEGA